MVTKRMVGAALVLAGIVLAVAAVVADPIGVARSGGFGVVRTLGLGGGLLLALAGGILVRTNGRPA